MPGLGKRHLVLKRIVDPNRMVVDEELKILAHDEGVKEFLVNDIEFLDRVILPGVMNVECQANALRGFGDARIDSQIKMVFERIGHSRDQFHSATRAIAGTIGPDVSIHRTKVNGIFRGIGSCRRLSLSEKQTGGNENQEHRLYTHSAFI